MTIGLTHYLTVAAVLFTLGIFGIFLNRKNVIVILMSIELMLLAVNLNLVAFSAFHGDLVGQIFAMIVLTVAAAEAAIGLAIVVVTFRNRGTIDVAEIDLQGLSHKHRCIRRSCFSHWSARCSRPRSAAWPARARRRSSPPRWC